MSKKTQSPPQNEQYTFKTPTFQSLFSSHVQTNAKISRLLTEYKNITTQLDAMQQPPVIHDHNPKKQFYQFRSNIPPQLQSEIISFIFTFISSKLSDPKHTPNLDFDYLFHVQQQSQQEENQSSTSLPPNESSNNNGESPQQQHNQSSSPSQSSPTLSNPFTMMQFNMLADHLSGSHPQFGNFEGIDIGCLQMEEFRQWKLLYILLEKHHFILPNQHSLQQHSLSHESYHNQLICIEELDQHYYLSFFGPVLALCGYNSCYSPKHFKNGKLPKNTHPVDMICDGTGLFSQYNMLHPDRFHLASTMGQLAVGALLQIPIQSISNTNNDTNNDNINKVEKKDEKDDEENIQQYHYIYAIATHLKAAKDDTGETTRYQQITRLYQHLTASIEGIINQYQQTPKLYPNLYHSKSQKYNLSIIVCGDFNAAPFYSNTTPYYPQTYQFCNENEITLNLPQVDITTMTSLQLSSVYSKYNEFYNSYIQNNNNNQQLSSQQSNSNKNHTKQQPSYFVDKVEPPQFPQQICDIHDLDENCIQLTHSEAPYTTIKTRGSHLSRHTIDYIWYNDQQVNNNDGNEQLLAPLQLIGIGTLPNTSQLPSVGLPDWCFPSDHLPLFAIFDIPQ